MKQTYRLIIEYDGEKFSGWQFQPSRRTVQGELEKALHILFKSKVSTVAASRTDAGVHAAGQVVSFRAPFVFRGNLAAALNKLLPDDVAVLSAKVANATHAQRDAVAKTYIYKIVNRPTRPVLARHHCAWVAPRLDLAAMRRRAGEIASQTDFSAYGGRSSRGRSPVCRFLDLKVEKAAGWIAIKMTADRFLHNMARRVAGELVNAGLKKGKGHSPRTMEPQGLVLYKVHYARPSFRNKA